MFSCLCTPPPPHSLKKKIVCACVCVCVPCRLLILIKNTYSKVHFPFYQQVIEHLCRITQIPCEDIEDFVTTLVREIQTTVDH